MAVCVGVEVCSVFSLLRARRAARRRCAEVNKIPAVTPGCTVTPLRPPFLPPAPRPSTPSRAAVQRGGFSLFSSGVVAVRCIRSLFFVDPYVRIHPRVSFELTFRARIYIFCFSDELPVSLLPSLYFFFNSAHFLSYLMPPFCRRLLRTNHFLSFFFKVSYSTNYHGRSVKWRFWHLRMRGDSEWHFFDLISR